MTPAELTEARKRLGLTQAQLAAATGYSRDQIGRIECGHTGLPLSLGLSVRAMTVLGVDPETWPSATS